MQHLINHVYKYDDEEFAVWLFTVLYKQKIHFPHAKETFKIDFLDTSLRVNALQCLVYSGFFKLALCLSEAGIIDKASSTRYKGERRQVAACGFLITAIVKEGISQEKLDLLVALANGHDIATSQHLISIYRGLRKRRYLGRYFAHPMMQNRRAKRDDYKPSAVRVTQRYVP
ncbi:hypothetical protein [Piscirickettsia salmonis]|nr:hypothetical protein [Piscirickettsia salmonis]